jgi:glutathione S-transferase
MKGMIRMPSFRLISHKLCPYVQRAVIVATEKGIPYERVDIDLANKPDWFLAISPTGKVPVLEVTDDDGRVRILFESAVIAEYLDEVSGNRLLPAEPLDRARERAWIEFASATLGDIGQLYSAPTAEAFEAAGQAIERRLSNVEPEIAGPWFGGETFGLVDAAFGPAFRYLDIFERRTGSRIATRSPKVDAWSKALAERPSVSGAVPSDYEELLVGFVLAKKSHLARLLAEQALLAA